MYLDNKYSQKYYSLVNRAKSRTLDSSIYVERHHVIPKSLGGSNKKSNLVKLTPREHFICHLLLPKMLVGMSKRKMMFALTNFINRARHGSTKIYKISSRTYQKIKIESSKYMSEIQTGRAAHNRGKSQTEKNKQSVREANSKKCIGPDGTIYNSTKEAGSSAGVTSATIRYRIQNQIGGWQYLDSDHQLVAETKRIIRKNTPTGRPKGHTQTQEHIKNRLASRFKK